MMSDSHKERYKAVAASLMSLDPIELTQLQAARGSLEGYSKSFAAWIGDLVDCDHKRRAGAIVVFPSPDADRWPTAELSGASVGAVMLHDCALTSEMNEFAGDVLKVVSLAGAARLKSRSIAASN